MTKTIFTLLFSITFLLQANAQDSIKAANPIQNEFETLIESSNNYQGYKVVDYAELNRLKNNVNNYIQELKNEIVIQKNTVDRQNDEIEKLEESLKTTQDDLTTVNEEKDAIKFLGLPFSKGNYKMLMWGIVALLVIALIFFIYRYKSSNATTKEANDRLSETEKEFEAFRVKSLEKEQRLGRLLQDERNKSSNN